MTEHRRRSAYPVHVARLALLDLSRVVESIYDSTPSIKDKLVLLGELQELERTLGETRAFIEARTAGAMVRSKVEDHELGFRAARSPATRGKWTDARRLLFDLLVLKSIEDSGGEVPDANAERELWATVDLVMHHGAYDPRVKPLTEGLGWSAADLEPYRKSEPVRRTVKVTFDQDTEDGAGDDDGDDAELDAGGPDGDRAPVDRPDQVESHQQADA